MKALTVPVSFRWSGPAGQRVELAGDFPDWKYPVPMLELTPGLYACELELAPGVYRYKFRLNGRIWVRDPLARLVDRADVYENGLLIVGGAVPPLVFAPDRRHLAVYEDGRAVFHLEVSDPACEPSHVWIQDDPDEPRRRAFAPLRVEASRGDWRLLRAEARLPPGRGRTRPVFGFSGAPEQLFQLPPPRPAGAAPPSWLPGSVFYTIFLDRWLRGSQSPPLPQARSRRAPSTAQTFYGGDLDGVRESLPYLQELGVTAVVLTPLHPSPTPHRYDSTDLLSIDPAVGGEAALGRLVEAVHARGMRLVLDVAVTHVNEAHPAFQDVLRRQRRSRFGNWFRLKRFPVVARDPSTFENYFDRPELPWLNLAPGPARRHAIKAVERLVGFGVDGLRFDAMDDAPADFWAELRAKTRALNPELLLLGEVVSDSPARYAEARGLDLATDFRHREAMLAFFARAAISAEEFWDRVRFDRFRSGPFDPSFHLSFLDNHDTARFLSLAVLYDRLRLALTYLLLRPEPVALTYGTEVGMAGSDPGHVLDDAWPERLPMPSLEAPASQTQGLLRTLARMRRELPALRGPELRRVRAEGRLLILDRVGPEATVRAWLNAGDEALPVGELPDRAQLLLPVNDPFASARSPLPGGAARLFLLPGPPPNPA